MALANYTDGGSDARLYTGTDYAWSGSNALNIQDNSGTSSSFTLTNGLDVTSFDQVEVEFYFYPRSMENKEDFWVRFYDGSTWHTVATFARGTDFQNNQFYSATVTIDASEYSFTSNTRIRFQCDASGNADDVYIDDVTISGIVSASATRTARFDKNVKLIASENLVNVESEIDKKLRMPSALETYPNPVRDRLNLVMKSTFKGSVNVQVFNNLGSLVYSRAFLKSDLIDFLPIDLGTVNRGVYILKVDMNDEILTKRFIKQ